MNTIKNVDYQDFINLIDLANDLEIYVECYEGCLIDNYILYNAEKMDVNGKGAKYIIGKETYKNCWSSDYTVILTNDINELNEYLQIFDNYDENEG